MWHADYKPTLLGKSRRAATGPPGRSTGMKAPETLLGKPIRWTFEEGPTKGMTFEHCFQPGGGVVWMLVGGEGEATRERTGSVERVSAEVFVAGYLSEASGWALTVALDFGTGKAVSFASNGKEWSRAVGTFELV
jgi:hypothetical protein